jgi:hypothetical protein
MQVLWEYNKQDNISIVSTMAGIMWCLLRQFAVSAMEKAMI